MHDASMYADGDGVCLGVPQFDAGFADSHVRRTTREFPIRAGYGNTHPHISSFRTGGSDDHSGLDLAGGTDRSIGLCELGQH